MGKAVTMKMVGSEAGRRKTNPIGDRYEIRWRSGDVKASYNDIGQAKDYLDDIDRPVGLFYGYDTETGKVFMSFGFQTKYPGYEIMAKDIEKTLHGEWPMTRKTNPGLSNQQMIDNFAKKLIRRVKHRMDDFGDSYAKAKAMVSLESIAGESAWAVVDKYFEDAKLKTNPEPSHEWAKLGKTFTHQKRKWEVIGYSHSGEWFSAVTVDNGPFQRARFEVEAMQKKRKTNPAAKKPIHFIAIMKAQGGLEYGADTRTPVEFTFSANEPRRGVYRVWQIPPAVAKNPAFQAWAHSNKTIVDSYNSLIKKVKSYA